MIILSTQRYRQYRVPVTDVDCGLRNNQLPVLPATLVRDTAADVDNPSNIVAGESVMVHHQNLQGYVLNVHAGDIKLERFVKDGSESVLFDT